MNDVTQIKSDLESLIKKLENPLTEMDFNCGWTEGAQTATLKLLRDIDNDLQRGKTLPHLNLGRGLDHWGVEEGVLLEEISRLSNKLRSL